MNMDNLKPPVVKVERHREFYLVPLLNTRKSAAFGLVLLVFPFLFLSGVILSHYLQLEIGILTSVYLWIGELDQQYGNESWMNWVIRLLLFAGPLAAILLNLLSVTHISYFKPGKELIISFKLRWLNWLLIIFCSSVFAVFSIYLLIENF